jgi:hypothetical protein
MKRYLYILLGALALASCEPTPTPAPEPIVEYHFGEMTAETTETSATITADIPYKTIDGVKDDSATFKLGYHANNGVDTFVEEYSVEGSKAIFVIDNLTADTKYVARLYIDDKMSDELGFATTVHTPTCEITCDATVEAKGIMATITLDNVAYIVDGEAQEVENVKLEYARKRSELEWVAVDMTKKESVTLPEEGGEYLDESSTYLYRVTITPANTEFEPMTTEEQKFETEYAEVTAEISKPDVAIVGNNIEVVVEGVKVWFDGVERPDYHYLEYFVYYREPGGEEAYWENKAEVELNNGGISLSLSLSSFEPDKEYEFAGAVVAGAERKVRLSDIVTITIPKEETPTPPTPPTPPVGGEGDTSTITGTWHLSEWRGAKPSFDVYMSITEDGVVTLWQRIESREWECFYSTATIEDGIITGRYTDGIAWGASYSVTVADDSMTWVDTADATDISVYTRSELPEGMTTTVKRASVAAVERFL